MRFPVLWFTLTSCAVMGAVPPDHAARMEMGLTLFHSEIGPLLRDHCLECHGGAKIRSDLNVSTREGLLRGGADGTVVVPFSVAESRLLRLVDHVEGGNGVESGLLTYRDERGAAGRTGDGMGMEWGCWRSFG